MHTSELLYCTPCLQRHGTQVLATRLHIGEPQCEICFSGPVGRKPCKRSSPQLPRTRPVPDLMINVFRAQTNSHARFIQRVVASAYGINGDNFLSPSHDRLLVVARHVAMYIVRERMSLSLPRIGKLFGKHHTSVLNSVRMVKDAISKDKTFKSEVESLMKICEPNSEYWAALGA